MKFIDSRIELISTYAVLARSPEKYGPLAGEGSVLVRDTVNALEVSPAVDVKVQDAMVLLTGAFQSG